MKRTSLFKYTAAFLCVFLFICCHKTVYAQQTPEDPSVELLKLSEQSVKRYNERSERVKKYAETHNAPIRYRDFIGRLIVMVDVEDGIPVYKSTDNADAAITTGVTQLQNGGSLGLNLEGEGMIVGIWDGGGVSHPEYASRVLSSQGNEDNHASHVTGTIMATGLNPIAKGMAPKAQSYNYDFDNDEVEMIGHARPDQTSLLLSNHSYGLITGWYFNGASWQWFGNPSISTTEDYRFGYYSANAAFWDQIAFNAPYYTMLKSAGNDRNNTGPSAGQYPPDCNLGGGYDCVGDVGTSKNIITVGAVNKVLNYTGPASVVMSSFSSWGPTDDGRIKPDFVAAGVNLVSTVTQGNYGSLSGTSMATPNATGSLVLLQELYKNLHGGNFMRASTLKALAIHTVKEAGFSPGPDYRFGWGLLDVHAGAKFLLAEDNVNFLIKEATLSQGQVLEYALTPKANEKITATIVWTDPSGTPVAASLDPTNIMLVNDLDIRIVDDAENTQFPWTLDPSVPDNAALTGDNIRDNVEKIEFASPQARPYKLRVSHKGTLRNEQQAFSLIISYTSLNDPGIAYYWVGGSGQWNDPAHWSVTSGGTTANAIPTINDRVFFDENSFSSGGTVTLTGDAAVSSLVWFADENISLAMAGHTLSIGSNFIVTSSAFSTTGNGKFLFTGEKSEDNLISLTDNVFGSLEFEFNGASAWKLEGLNEIHRIDLVKGDLTLEGQQIVVNEVNVNSGDDKFLNISSSSFQGVSQIELDGNGLELNSSGTTIIAGSNTVIDLNDVEYDGSLVLDGSNIQLTGNSSIASIEINSGSSVAITGNNIISSLTVEEGVELELTSGSTQTLSQNTSIASSESNAVEIFSSSLTPASLNFDGHFKVCFDNLIITNVNATGDGVIGVGVNSSLTNSANWNEQACDNILFADFTYGLSCVGSLVQFESTGSGGITEWSWDFGDESTTLGVSEDESPVYIYTEQGTYTVTLTVSDGTSTETFSRELTIGPNDLIENHIVSSNGTLFSFRSGPSYQWYKDGELIPGATERGYNFMDEEGIFIVVISNGTCNRASAPFVNVITGVEDDLTKQISVYPNPAQSVITVEVPASFGTHYQTVMFDTFGKALSSQSHTNRKTSVSVEALHEGVYFIQIINGNKRVVKKFLVSRH